MPGLFAFRGTMANQGSTTQQTDDAEAGVHRLRDIVVEEVSLVDRAANKRRFLLVKRSNEMADDEKPTGAGSRGGASNKKPRRPPWQDAGKGRPRVMRAGTEGEDDGQSPKKTRRSAASAEVDEEDEDTEKARRRGKDDDREDEDAEKADNGNGEEEEDEGEDEGATKRRSRERGGVREDEGEDEDADDGAESAGGANKAGGDDLVLPSAVKNALLRGLAQALERLMALANQVKEADGGDDDAEPNVPAAFTQELEDIGELLEGIGEQLESPAEKARGGASDARKSNDDAAVTKAGRRMAKDRLARFQKALELLAAVLKELTEEKPKAAPGSGQAEAGVRKRVPEGMEALAASVQELARTVQKQEARIERLQKTRATSNAIAVDGQSRRREVQEVSWPLDMNRPITRDRVDKTISFYDE